jgi:hypothetical protein
MRKSVFGSASAAVLCLLLSFSYPNKAQGDVWGADVAVLAQILSETVMELAQLKSILSNGQDSLNFMQDINRGINDSLQMAKTLGLRIDPGIYRELGKVVQALSAVENIYGQPVNSPVATVQRNTDQTVAEAISFNNELNDYASRLDGIGEEIKNFSHSASPGGAAKLTAESLGVLIHVMDQQMRAQGQGLKLQAQAMAVENKKEKDHTEQYIKEGQALEERMTALNPTFQVPRF